MSNQRPGKKHKAAALDNTSTIDVRKLLNFLEAAKKDLDSYKEEQAAFRFEMFIDFVRNEYLNGKPFVYTSAALGI